MTTKQMRTLKGFRDFLPDEKRKRDYIQSKLEESFKLYGFQPLETPTLEYASLLLGKYGEEADKLVYTFQDRGERNIGLRYDQTVPTARVMTQYQYELGKYFRRYQIQNVFRADKPQKGRYREFTQCDLDIYDAPAPLADAEILAATYTSFKNVGFENVELRINDRKILFDILKPYANDKIDVFTIIQNIDKLDKMSKQEVIQILTEKGLDQDKAQEVLDQIFAAQVSASPELKAIIEKTTKLGVPKNSLVFTPYLARGLDYYTGMIFEIIIPEYKVGSCGGGGRYDNLMKDLGGEDVPAVGVGIGFDRMVEAADELGILPDKNLGTQVLLTLFDDEKQVTYNKTLEVAQELRSQAVRTAIYPEFDRLGKQLKFANKNDIPWVIIIGEDEVKANKVALKNMKSGKQEKMTLATAIEKIKT